MRKAALLLAVVVMVGVLAMRDTADGAGPWRAQIVDAETGQPLEGVVVLFVWHKMTRTPGGPSPAFEDAEEAVTGPDGRSTIRARRLFTLNPFKYIEGPEVVIFKPGYGQWGVRGGFPPEWEELEVGDVFQKEGLVIELPPLKTREERLKFYRTFRGSPTLVPPKHTKRLREAEDVERMYLGLDPKRGGKP